MVVRAVGSIPGPIVVGALFDSSCLHWQEDCGDRGKCYVYDNDDLTLRLFSLAAGIKVLSIICGFFAWIFFGVRLFDPSKKCVPPPKQKEVEKIDPIN